MVRVKHPRPVWWSSAYRASCSWGIYWQTEQGWSRPWSVRDRHPHWWYRYLCLFPLCSLYYCSIHKWQIYLSQAMIDQYIEFRPSPDGESFSVCFRNFRIAEIKTENGELIHRNITRLWIMYHVCTPLYTMLLLTHWPLLQTQSVCTFLSTTSTNRQCTPSYRS